MTTTKLFLFVLCFAVSVGMCRSWVEDVAEENTDSLSGWARNRFSQDLGSENDDATQNMKYKAENAASRATEVIGNDEIIRMPTDKASKAKDTVQNTYEDAKQKINTASDKASNMAHNVYDEVKDRMGCGGNDNTFGVYDEAKDKVSEAYMSAKNSMSEEAKEKYEAAKEKASEATGNLGAKMRNAP